MVAFAEARKCYSCMSEVYGKMWERAGYNRIYAGPQSSHQAFAFTDHCSNPDEKPDDVGMIQCPESDNCIALKEKLQLGKIYLPCQLYSTVLYYTVLYWTS